MLRSRSSEPSLGARWIWAEHAARTGAPVTLYAARDFELPEGIEKAWLSIAADESYVLWVNGQAVGSGYWQDGKAPAGPASQAADLYELSDWLERGSTGWWSSCAARAAPAASWPPCGSASPAGPPW